jgi:hypothetical protein
MAAEVAPPVRQVWPYLFPKTLRAAGYKTALFGKCMNGDCGANAFAGGGRALCLPVQSAAS